MKATVSKCSYQEGWYVTIAHETPYMSISQYFPREEDANAIRDWFNFALYDHVARELSYWRPAQSMSDDIYGTKEAARASVQPL